MTEHERRCSNECENWDKFFSSCKLTFYTTSIEGKKVKIHPTIEHKDEWLLNQVGCASYAKKFDASELVSKRTDRDSIKAPFTDDQVKSLNAYQRSGVFHSYTCTCGNHINLIATKNGWVCEKCAYTQNWAHAWTADWSWKKYAM